MSAQRLFVAVEIPDDVHACLVDRLAPWQAQLPGWRWAEPARWHLTLAFLGDVEPETGPELSRRLARAATRHEPFEVGLGGVGAFTRPARATVLWIGVPTGRERLVRLAGSVAAAARRSGIALEERIYRPHLTVGRRRAAVDVRDQLRLGADLRAPTWRVSSYSLVESHLGPQPRHVPVEGFGLGR